jgi:hypothetical protein
MDIVRQEPLRRRGWCQGNGIDVYNVGRQVAGAATRAAPVACVDSDERGTPQGLHAKLIGFKMLVRLHIFHQKLDVGVRNTQYGVNLSGSQESLGSIVIETTLLDAWRRGVTRSPGLAGWAVMETGPGLTGRSINHDVINSRLEAGSHFSCVMRGQVSELARGNNARGH